MPCIVRIFWQPHARVHPRAVWYDIELPDCADFEAALEAIAVGQLIGGHQLWSDRGADPQERIVTRRRFFAFRGSAVDRVELPDCRFVEEAA